MIVSKAVQCARRGCRALGQQNINTDLAAVVANCPKCGGPSVMYLGYDESVFSVEENLAINDLVDLALAGSATHNKLFRNELALGGYRLLGFHGCGRKAAASIIGTGVDTEQSKNKARGTGFYVGSHYDGLARSWSQIAAGREGTPAIILAVFTNSFDAWNYGEHYDWGKMDEEDDDSAGLEIAVFPNAVASLRIGPAIPGDHPDISWAACPKDSLSYGERIEMERYRPKLILAAKEFKLSYGQLVKKILSENLSDEQKRILTEKYGIA